MEFVSFGKDRPLVGVRSPAMGRSRQTGILICQSLAFEYERCYRGLAILSAQLASRGFDTVRFDYSCTGDSAGDSADAAVEHWLEDIASAARELREVANVSRVCLIGIRFGGLLAAGAIRNGLKIHHLVCWDSPDTGSQWLDQMDTLARAYYDDKNRYRTHRFQLRPVAHELVGMPLPPSLAASIRGSNLDLGTAPPACTLIGSQAEPSGTNLPGAEYLPVPDAGNWTSRAWLHTPWSPTRSFTALREHLEKVLP